MEEVRPSLELFESKGFLHYECDRSGYKLHLIIDKDIVNYYYSLAPKYLNLKRQAFRPHISVVRNEQIPNLHLWGKHEGKSVDFVYSSNIYYSDIYFWMDCFSLQLEEIRRELGLTQRFKFDVVPPPYTQLFHITIGNLKPAEH